MTSDQTFAFAKALAISGQLPTDTTELPLELSLDLLKGVDGSEANGPLATDVTGSKPDNK